MMGDMHSHLDELNSIEEKVTAIMINRIREKAKAEFIKDIEPKIEKLDIDEKAKLILFKATVDSFKAGMTIIEYLKQQEDYTVIVEKN